MKDEAKESAAGKMSFRLENSKKVKSRIFISTPSPRMPL